MVLNSLAHLIPNKCDCIRVCVCICVCVCVQTYVQRNHVQKSKPSLVQVKVLQRSLHGITSSLNVYVKHSIVFLNIWTADKGFRLRTVMSKLQKKKKRKRMKCL